VVFGECGREITPGNTGSGRERGGAARTEQLRASSVGAVKPLVPKDKRFNHSKVWCTFIFIDLQAMGDCSVYDEPSFKYIELSPFFLANFEL